MMRSGKLLSLSLLVLVALSLVPSLTVYAAKEDQKKAEQFIKIAENALEQATKLMDRALEKGLDISAMSASITSGENLLEEAEAALTAGDFALAIEKARSAQETLRGAMKSESAASASEDDEVEKGRGLLVAINQTRERIQRLKDVNASLAKITTVDPLYVNWFNANVSKAEANLTFAVYWLTPPHVNVTKAAQSHAEANKYVEKAFITLKLIGEWNLAWRVESFLNGIRKQLESAKKQLEKAKNQLDPTEYDELKQNLVDAETAIGAARTALIEGDKGEALDEVKDARNLIHEVLKALPKGHKR